MIDTKSNYHIYNLHGLPAGVFGESYVIVAWATDSEGKYRSEHHILTQRPQESLKSGILNINANNLPTELGTIDENFAIEESLRQANIDLYDLLEKRSIELKRPDVALLPFDLKKCPSPFVGCRMRGLFIKPLEDIGSSTKCPSLTIYLRMLQNVTVAK
jgi:hypothetical protein